MIVKPHHFPNELTERIYQLVTKEGELSDSEVAAKLDISKSAVCTACLDDLRLVHTFKSDQVYYISGKDTDATTGNS